LKRIFQRRRFLKHRKPRSYRPGWRFPQIIEHEISKWILSPCLHVCSGQSTLGDIRLDLYEPADVKAAMRYLPFQSGAFASIIWDLPYAMHIRQTQPALIELREALHPGGRLITVHYLDPGNFLQRSMRLLWKAYYEPKQMGGVRVVTVLEKLPTFRLKPGRTDRLIEVPVSIWEPDQLELASISTGTREPIQVIRDS